MMYAELDITTNFSFLRGASHPAELVHEAKALGQSALAVADLNTLAGAVRMHQAAKESEIHLCIGSRLRFVDAPDVLVWAENRGGYANLCRLLTTGKHRAQKGECTLYLDDLPNSSAGLWAAIVGQSIDPEFGEPDLAAVRAIAGPLKDVFGKRLSLTVSRLYVPSDDRAIAGIEAIGRARGIPLLATNQVHYHDEGRRLLQDVLTCIRHGCSIREAGFRLFPNGRRIIRSPEEMQHLFYDLPGALRRTIEVSQACKFSLDELQYEYPEEVVPPGKTSASYLAELTWAGAAEKYPQGIPEKVRLQINHELALIEQRKYEPYFLTVYDLVRFAKSQNILCQGRGSAANSAVCYCLGVTSVASIKWDSRMYRDSHRSYLSAKRLAVKHGFRFEEGIARGGIGENLILLGNFRKGYGELIRSLDIAREVGDRTGEIDRLTVLSVACRAAGRPEWKMRNHELKERSRKLGINRPDRFDFILKLGLHKANRRTLIH
jgi:error-prone DNA polymerase